MNESAPERLRLLENILDHMSVALTYVDSEGTIQYANRTAVERPFRIPRDVGMNIRDCHKEETNITIAHMFEEFKKGRREPHHYVGKRTGKAELVVLIPFFEGDTFVGCLGQIHPLEVEGPEKSFL
jgi:DUF438 domain-containing protein